MKKPFSIILIFSFVLWEENVFPAGLRCDFSQENRTYIWNLRFDYDQQRTSLFSWGVSSSINSSLTKRSNAPDWRKEEGKIDLNVDYLLTQKSRIGAFFSQNIYSSEKTKTTTSDYGVISKLNLAGINFIQVLGAKNIDRRWGEIKRSEQGLNYSQTIFFSPRIFYGSVTEISLNQTLTHLKNIPILQRDFNLSFFRYFSDSQAPDSDKDSLRVAYLEAWAKKKFFASEIAASQINTQKKNQRVLNLCASKKVPGGLKLDFAFDFLSNRYRYSADSDTLLDPLLTDNLASSENMYLGLKKTFWQKVLVGGFYKYMRSDEDYKDNKKDQKMEGGELGGEMKAEITKADSLYLTASIGVTSFYAPFSGQFNDRDILTILSWGEYLHTFNSYFNLRVEGGFRNFHQLYISNLLSSNNNHNQTYLLSPAVTWQPDSRLSFKQNYSIQANYIYYDYEKASESKNKLFRRASSTSGVIYRYNQRVIFTLGYIYRYEDYGQLVWKNQWVQKPSWDRRTNTINLSIDYQPLKRVSFSPMCTYEKIKSWDHVPDETTLSEGKTVKEKRILKEKFYRNMISFSCKYLVDKDNYLNFSVAHRLENGTQNKQETYDYATVSVARVF